MAWRCNADGLDRCGLVGLIAVICWWWCVRVGLICYDWRRTKLPACDNTAGASALRACCHVIVDEMIIPALYVVSVPTYEPEYWIAFVVFLEAEWAHAVISIERGIDDGFL